MKSASSNHNRRVTSLLCAVTFWSRVCPISRPNNYRLTPKWENRSGYRLPVRFDTAVDFVAMTCKWGRRGGGGGGINSLDIRGYVFLLCTLRFHKSFYTFTYENSRRGSRNFCQGGGGGGSNFPKILTSKKKKKEEGKRTESCGGSFPHLHTSLFFR